MRKMYELILEKRPDPVYNESELRGYRIKKYLYRFRVGICKEIKKEVFSL